MDAHENHLVGTLSHGEYTAEVFSTNIPGEFKVVYQDASGKQLEEAPLTGISSYRQRENEIREHLSRLAHGETTAVPDLGDPGEY